MRDEVLEGLSRPLKEISPKYFYDAHGSELFEQITELPEYYPTRTERGLLESWMPAWVGEYRPSALVELGAGSAAKTRVILDAMRALEADRVYVPVDVSGDFLRRTAARLRAEYPGLAVQPAVADFVTSLRLPIDPPEPTWYALLGSTLGNFPEVEGVRLLSRVAERMRRGDGFILGADLAPGPGKSRARLEAAYNDEDGVTARFNLNVLRVLNREVGTDFDLTAFEHHAAWVPEHSRIEMYLVATRDQDVSFPGGAVIQVSRGERIRTEISCKYDRTALSSLLAEAGLAVDRWQEDGRGAFALLLARRVH